jgi:hypothetical protein
MKLSESIKNFLLVFAPIPRAIQIPIALALLITAYVERLLMKSMACLKKPSPWLIAVNQYNCQADREQVIRYILSAWDKKSDHIIAKDRRTFESTEWGQRAIQNSPDRHLYAVLRPTRKENLERIGNVLREIDSTKLHKVLRNAEKMRRV